jgi:large subunit ribosomal protein L18
MANSSNYRVQLRRRREGKTDYQARKALVISRRPRLVTRTSIRNVNAQIILSKQKGDQVLASANSRELIKKYGWKAPTGNIPAAYLTGLLVGLKAKAAGVDGAILDIGLITPTKGARIFAVLSGVVDAGVEVPHSEEKLAKNRLKGDHIARYAKSLGEGSEEYNSKFSKYNAGGVAPEKVAEHFSKVRAEIVGSFKGAKVAPEPESAPEPKAKVPKQTPKPEVKAPISPKAGPKAPVETQAEAKSVIKAEAKPEVKAAKEKVAAEEAPKAKEKETSKDKAEAKIKVNKETPKEKAEKVRKTKLTATEEAAPKKAVSKAKTAKKEEAPKEKPAKKGGKKA